jgi:hypothetical protein
MYKSLASVAAATVLATFAAAGPTSAAEQRQATGVDQALAGQQQNAEEFTSQRRRYRRGRYVVRRGYWGPGYGYYGPRYGYYGYPYAYAQPYPYRYYGGPAVSFGFGPFGFRAW